MINRCFEPQEGSNVAQEDALIPENEAEISAAAGPRPPPLA